MLLLPCVSSLCFFGRDISKAAGFHLRHRVSAACEPVVVSLGFAPLLCSCGPEVCKETDASSTPERELHLASFNPLPTAS